MLTPSSHFLQLQHMLSTKIILGTACSYFPHGYSLCVHYPSDLFLLVVGHNHIRRTEAQAEYKILYSILYSSMNGIGLFSGITQVQNFCSWSILNSDPVPCTYFCFEPVLHMEPHPEFPCHSWFFPILVLYHMQIFLSLLTLH